MQMHDEFFQLRRASDKRSRWTNDKNPLSIEKLNSTRIEEWEERTLWLAIRVPGENISNAHDLRLRFTRKSRMEEAARNAR